MKIPGARTFMMKRSLVIGGHKSSVSLEPEFWECFTQIARQRNLPFSALVSEIDQARTPAQNLSSAIRVYVLQDARARAISNRKSARENAAKAEKLQIALNEYVGACERIKEGLAPLTAVIAGARTNG